ncbi:MAG: hypothetical protein NTU58_00400 [Candidatus Nealsonbacteria bacterium]|nr:hypothetical protein [Candidatus Nealsonbacteria bacterium]
MVRGTLKMNWRYLGLGFLLSGAAIFIGFFFQIENDDFPEKLLIGIALIVAFILIVAGCNNCKFLSKKKNKTKEV